MEATKCKTCGERHYGICSGERAARGKVLSQVRREEAAAKRPVPAMVPRKAEPKLDTPGPDGRLKPGRKLRSEFVTADGSFDRVAYQRDYMRRKRAKKKAKDA